jgi:hypothetical protein
LRDVIAGFPGLGPAAAGCAVSPRNLLAAPTQF